IIDPAQKNVTLYWQDGKSRHYKENEWAKSRGIKGFRLKVSWLWQTKSISVLEKFKELKI
ncbi:MAG: hypothetical protein R6U96_18535, partial [Promethearchaeia archaeon]